MLGRNGSGLSRATIVATGLTVLFLTAISVWGVPGVSAAQVTPTALTCARLLPLVQKNLKSSCTTLDRDQVCYGNNTNTATYQDAANSMPFAIPGDIVPVDMLKSVNTAPLNLQTGDWGLSVLKVHADVPGTVAGQAVTFVLYGDTSVLRPDNAALATAAPDSTCTATTTRSTYLRAVPAGSGAQIVLAPPNTTVNVEGRLADSSWMRVNDNGAVGWLAAQNAKLSCDAGSLSTIDPNQPSLVAGMSAFYFSTAVGPQATCKDIPAGGLLIQSPKGAKVHFRANGADISIGSTVILTAEPNKQMWGYVIDGHMTVDTGTGTPQTAQTGQKIMIPLGASPNGLGANGAPDAPQPIRSIDNLNLPTLCQIARTLGLTMPCAVGGLTVPRPTFTAAPINGAPPASITMTATVAGNAACTFTVNRFSADQNPVRLGNNGEQGCTTIRWDVSGTQALSVQRQGGATTGVPSPGAMNVCIGAPTTFTLIQQCNGEARATSLTLGVQSAPAAPTSVPTDPPPAVPR